ILSVLVLFGGENVLSQRVTPSDEIRKKFPDESAVFVERSTTLNFVFENDSLKGFADVYEDVLHLKNQTDNYANRKVYGSSLIAVDDLRGRTLVRQKNKYREIPVTG